MQLLYSKYFPIFLRLSSRYIIFFNTCMTELFLNTKTASKEYNGILTQFLKTWNSRVLRLKSVGLLKLNLKQTHNFFFSPRS